MALKNTFGKEKNNFFPLSFSSIFGHIMRLTIGQKYSVQRLNLGFEMSRLEGGKKSAVGVGYEVEYRG